MSARRLLRVALIALPLAGSLPALSAGDPVRGQGVYESRCSACHSLDENRVGPAHRGVFGRKAGSAPGYSYSPALASSSVVWSDESLEKWLLNPEKFIPGQKMSFSVADAGDRRDVVAYLKANK